MRVTVKTHKSAQQIRELVDLFGKIIAGRSPDRLGLAETFWSAVIFSLSTSIYQAYLKKSSHQADDLGNTWQDHTPQTKAYSLPSLRTGLSLPGPLTRPTLTEHQDKLWRYIYASKLAYFRTQMDEAEASQLAAKMAWSTVKRHGAQTLLELTKHLQAPLLNKTGALLASLTPGIYSGGIYHPPEHQIYRRTPSELTYGTDIPYAARVAEKRPLWPVDIQPWIDRAVEFGLQAVLHHVTTVL